MSTVNMNEMSWKTGFSITLENTKKLKKEKRTQ